jgi:hypothetical protein
VDHPAPVVTVEASNYPMPSGRHLRDPTLPMVATRANPLVSNVSQAPKHRGPVISCACTCQTDLICQLDSVSEIPRGLALPGAKNGGNALPSHSTRICYSTVTTSSILSLLTSLFSSNYLPVFVGFCEHFKSMGMIEQLSAASRLDSLVVLTLPVNHRHLGPMYLTYRFRFLIRIIVHGQYVASQGLVGFS